MAEGVKVDIKDAYVISALNTPGGDVYEWRNGVERSMLESLFANSPVNDAMNAEHRIDTGPPPGDYQRSWVSRRQGNGHRIGFQIENFSEHAIFVEEDRSPSTKIQVFSWTGWHGDIRAVGFPWGTGTRGRRGKHLLRDTTNRVLAEATGGDYAPLT